MAKAPEHWVAKDNVITNTKGAFLDLARVYTTVKMHLGQEDTLAVSPGETTKIDDITGSGKVTIMPGAALHCKTFEGTLDMEVRNGGVLDGDEVSVAGHTAPDADNA